MSKQLQDKLANPPKEYRAVPFWSWNDKLDPEELQWQVREMDKAGLGGYFMHARAGMKTEYMSPEWFECIGACVEEGKKIGMNSWCYDENGWPSGFANGAVPALGEKYHVQNLQCEFITEDFDLNNPNIINLFAVDTQKRTYRIVSPEEMVEDEHIQYSVVYYQSNPYYIDILNPEVVKSFIDLTHEKYYEQFSEDFDEGHVKGFFTDEPQFARNKIPWSGIFRAEFEKRFGYDICEHIIVIFKDCEGAEPIRYHFWSLVNDLYSTAFAGQIGDWCEKHNCQLTGHAMLEDNIFHQLNATAGVMPGYEYYHIPGIDWLGRGIQTSAILPKQVSSVADQLGKKFVLTETFALCGWDVSFEELKWIGEWQYVNGINLMCQHLQSYSINGLRKRDYPPSLFYQQSWWEEYKVFNDYFARLAVILADGQPVTDVLLLHPLKSGWTLFKQHSIYDVLGLDEQFEATVNWMSQLHYDYHLGDETIMRRHGRIEDGQIVIGNCRYNTVVLPYATTLDASTVALLEEFIRAGGQVLSTGALPTRCEGVLDEERLAYINANIISAPSKEALEKALAATPAAHVCVRDAAGEVSAIEYCQRTLEGQKAYFLVNTDHDNGYDTTVTLPHVKGNVRLYNAVDNTYHPVEFTQGTEDITLALHFDKMQSYMLIVDGTPAEAEEAPEAVTLTLGKDWTIDHMDLNSLTLDYCMYSIDGGAFEGPIHTINLLALLLNKRAECDVALKFTFNVDMDLSRNREIYAVIEKANECTFEVNGQKISYTDEGWWKDKSFKRVDIKPLVKMGENEIIVYKRFYQSPGVYHVLFGENVLESEKNKLTYDTELESMYIVGDFGVVSQSGYTYGERKAVFTDGPFVLVDQPTSLTSGIFTEQGLCFFAGKLRISQNFTAKKGQQVKLITGRLDTPLYKVYINGTPAALLPWSPFETDITPYIHEGENTLTLELFASNRNLLGPHHFLKGESHHVGPSTFTSTPDSWVDGDIVGSSWRGDDYCFVAFGIPEN